MLSHKRISRIAENKSELIQRLFVVVFVLEKKRLHKNFTKSIFENYF